LLLSPRDQIYEVILPLLRMSGERWERGTWQVAHEHLVSAAVRNLLGSLLRRQIAGHVRLLFTTPEGELHEFGILVAAMLAAVHGFAVTYLGPNMSARDIQFAAVHSVARVVVLGTVASNAASNAASNPAPNPEIDELAGLLPDSTELWLGGAGVGSGSLLSSGRRVVALESIEAFEEHLATLSPSYFPGEAQA